VVKTTLIMAFGLAVLIASLAVYGVTIGT